MTTNNDKQVEALQRGINHQESNIRLYEGYIRDAQKQIKNNQNLIAELTGVPAPDAALAAPVTMDASQLPLSQWQLGDVVIFKRDGSVGKLRWFDPEDLNGRDPLEVQMSDHTVRRVLQRDVTVTGGPSEDDRKAAEFAAMPEATPTDRLLKGMVALRILHEPDAQPAPASEAAQKITAKHIITKRNDELTVGDVLMYAGEWITVTAVRVTIKLVYVTLDGVSPSLKWKHTTHARIWLNAPALAAQGSK